MRVTITEFRELAKDKDGNDLPLGRIGSDCLSQTAYGAFAALNDETRFIRVATDTNVMTGLGLFCANVPEYVAVNGGETITTSAA